MHNLQLTEDQDIVVDTVRKFVADVVGPATLDADEHRQPVAQQFAALAELGVFGLLVAEANGGAGMGAVPFVAALESVGAANTSLARLWIEQAQCAAALEAAGGKDLDAIVGGANLAVFVGAEHGVRCANGRLTGAAAIVPGGGAADRVLVAARDGETVVLAEVAGAAVRRSGLRALGLNSASCARVEFVDTAATVLATGAGAAAAIARAEFVARIGTAAAAVGSGQASIAAAKKHAGERIAFGKPLLVQEAVQRKLVESRRQVDAARQLVFHAARTADLGLDSVEATLQARIAAVDAMVLAADEAIQIHGGFGYTVEYHVERHYRDGKMLEVLDGGAETMRDQLARRQFA
ncbi:MAG: acyl-CoA/acyl-ACP dehydrogenase [Planctomycetes bacterium]|nr:acyl-CoA/acyl-ACP dehydrogenase [Planctomycetota bacterium]